MDITAALVVYGVLYGVRPVRLLQGIAAGLLGAAAYKQGLPTAVLGLLLHFLIAFMAAAVYFAFSRALPFMVRHAVPSGVLYGVAVYIFMQAVVLPLSAATRYGFSWKLTSIGVVIHILCVGCLLRWLSGNIRCVRDWGAGRRIAWLAAVAWRGAPRLNVCCSAGG